MDTGYRLKMRKITLDECRVVLAGVGVVTLVCLMPICGAAWWVSDVVATKQWTVQSMTPIVKAVEETQSRVHSMEMNQVRHTAVLENLTSVLGDLKVTLKEIQTESRAAR